MSCQAIWHTAEGLFFSKVKLYRTWHGTGGERVREVGAENSPSRHLAEMQGIRAWLQRLSEAPFSKSTPVGQCCEGLASGSCPPRPIKKLSRPLTP